MMRKHSRSKRSVAVAIAAATVASLATFAAPKPAAAQEIQITGPLAGQPPVRRLRQYREGRADITVGWAPTLLDEYQRTHFLAGRVQYNIFEWLGVGVFGGFGLASLDTDLTEKIQANAPRNTRTEINIPRNGDFSDQTGKMKWMAAPQLTFSPFRGKLAVFQKLFVDTDLYLHGGAAFVGVQERANCGPDANMIRCADPRSYTTASRVAISPTFGLGLSLYLTNFISANIEYRAFPFAYNRGGFDSRGSGPGEDFPNPEGRIDDNDQTFKFNQLVFIGVGFHLPTTPKLSD